MPSDEWVGDFTRYACRKLEQNLAQIIRCTGLLSDEGLWLRPNEHSNAVGNLILHLAGNVRQWILSGIAGEPFDRDRPAEFAERGPRPSAHVLARLSDVVQRAVGTISALDQRSLGLLRSIQGYDVTVLAAVFHVVEHFSFHTGQIVYATKAIKNVDVSLYDAQGRRIGGVNSGP